VPWLTEIPPRLKEKAKPSQKSNRPLRLQCNSIIPLPLPTTSTRSDLQNLVENQTRLSEYE
jgi:hypothetical protein